MAVRDTILDAALDAFTEKGYAGATIDDVRRGSGASVGSIYHHFGGKEELAGALYAEAIGDYLSRIADELERHADAEAGIKAVVDFHLDWVLAEPERVRFVIGFREAELQPGSRAAVRTLNARFGRRFGRWLVPHHESGAIRGLPQEAYSALVLGPADELVRGWLARGWRSRALARAVLESREILRDAAWRAVKGDS
jgi:AcrR family transcriptional regulator